VPSKPLRDGTATVRFVFEMTMTSADRPILVALRDRLGHGSIQDRPPRRAGWAATSSLQVTSRRAHLASTVPFMKQRLPPFTAKRRQFDLWLDALMSYESLRPRRTRPSICRVAGCERTVRGRGLCRRHYYRATGY